MNSIFPQLTEYNVPFYYGIDFNKFSNINNIKKIPYKFIYSSFPNRGLLQLLQMWREIYNMQPNASLHIYADIDGKWVNDVEPEQIKNIKLLLDEYKNLPNGLNIKYYGWVDKKTLADSWLSSDIWFYPCTFMETFCLTALEAALTKTLVITNDLAALQNTAGDRGVIINGDANTSEWQQNALSEIKKYICTNDYLNSKNELINKNYKWAETLSWENQARKLIDTYITPLNQ
jgi:glycosyltransferase involved in cell wall biosynthesis